MQHAGRANRLASTLELVPTRASTRKRLLATWPPSTHVAEISRLQVSCLRDLSHGAWRCERERILRKTSTAIEGALAANLASWARNGASES